MLEIVEEVPAFNASFAVTDLLMKTLENAAKTVATECVKTCAKHYNFDAEEAIRMLGLENLALTRKLMAKKSAGTKKEKTAKAPKAKKAAVFPMPFCAELISAECCKGLAYNRGLYTQCPKKQLENGSYCKACQADADSNTSGVPTCGNVEMRLACGLYEYKDLKGRSPINYAKILNKLKLTQEQAIEAASKLNIELDAEHFIIVEKTKKSASKAGRPKKQTGAITADGATDLFEKMESDSDSNATGDIEGQPAKAKKTKLTDEEKAAKKAALEAERAAKKAEREAKAAEEKAEKEAKRKEEAALKKAEKEAKAAEEKAEREAKRNAEKAEREAKKLAEKQAKEAEKEAKKLAKESAKKPATTTTKKAAEPTPAPAPIVKAPVVEAPQKVKVVAITIDGVAYLKSSTNILYNPATREEVGIYDPATKTVLPLPDEDEEEEEGYESE